MHQPRPCFDFHERQRQQAVAGIAARPRQLQKQVPQVEQLFGAWRVDVFFRDIAGLPPHNLQMLPQRCAVRLALVKSKFTLGKRQYRGN